MALPKTQQGFLDTLSRYPYLSIPNTEGYKPAATARALHKKGLIVILLDGTPEGYTRYALPSQSEDVTALSEGHLSNELPAYRDEAFEAEQRAMTPADYDIPAPPVSPIAVVVPDFIAAKDARIATLEARLAKIDAAFDECAKLAERNLPHEEYVRLWGIRLEQLFATVAQSKPQDHAEIAARQADDNDNRSAGEGIYF